MKTAALIQARMGSSRLPGKTLMNLKNKPILWHVIDRLKKSVLLDDIVILTTIEKRDNVIEKFCIENNIKFFRGSENNVLERYYLAAKEFEVTNIVRITADCPLIDPYLINILIRKYEEGGYDFYGVGKGFPNGINGAVISFNALEKSHINCKEDSEREHVGEYIKNHKSDFAIGFYDNKGIDMSKFRVTLDTKEDYIFIKGIYDELYIDGKIITLDNVLSYLQRESR